jgi:hypothetical protein
MKTKRIVAAVFALLLAALAAGTHASTPQNLLRNPGLEGTYIPFNGIGELKTAPEWTPFFKENIQCLPDWSVPGGSAAHLVKRPEYKDATLDIDERRVRSGEKAQVIFVTYGVEIGGVYQKVPGLVGNPVVQASFYGQSWASARNDPTKNEGGDMFATVCIDPRGGDDPWARRVQCAEWQWVPPSGPDGEFAQIYSPEVRVDGGQVTVFILFMGRWATLHNDGYADDASLWIVESGGAPTPCPTPGPGGECNYDEIERRMEAVLERSRWGVVHD